MIVTLFFASVTQWLFVLDVSNVDTWNSLGCVLHNHKLCELMSNAKSLM